MSLPVVRLRVVMLPVMIVGLLQVSGCTPRQADPPPPGGAYISRSAGALFEQAVTIVDDEEEYIANDALSAAYRLPHDAQRVYAAAGEAGIVKSTNGGESWSRIETPLQAISDIVVLKNDILVASGTNAQGQGYIIRSADDGKSWEVALTIPLTVPRRRFQIIREVRPPESRIISLEIDPFHDDRIYAGSSLGSILVGEQSAKTWRVALELNSQTFSLGNRDGLSITEIIASPHQEGELLLITSGKSLLRIRDTDQEEILIPENVSDPSGLGYEEYKEILDAAYVADFPNALFVGVHDGAVISRDGGKKWTQLALPVEQLKEFNTIEVATSTTNANRLLVAINSVVFRSEDGGKTWNTFSLNLPRHGISDLLIDPENAANVLALTIPLGT